MRSIIDSTRMSTAHVAPAQLVIRAIGMLTTVVIARYLSVSDYGVYNFFFGSILVFSFLTNLGFAGSLQRFLAEYARLNKIGLLFRTFFFSIGYRTISGLLVFFLAVLLFPQFSGFFKVSEYHIEFVLFCVATFMLFQIDFLQIVLNSLFMHKYTVLAQIMSQIIRFGTISCLLMFGGSLIAVYAGELAAYTAGCFLIWFIFWKQVFVPKNAEYQKSEKIIEWKRFLRFSAYNAATIPGGILFNQATDFFVVAAMSTTNMLGIYALGSRASTMLISIMPQNLLQTVVRPAFYHRYYSVEEKIGELNRLFHSLVVLIAIFLFPALALVAVKAEPILVFIFKAKFAESTPVFLMLLAFNVFTVLELPSDLVLQAIEKVQARLYAQIFAVYNILAAILLMPEYGMLGVAFATGSALMGKTLFWFFMARYYCGISLCWKQLLQILINTSAAAATTYIIGRFGNSGLWLLFSLCAGGFVYLALFPVNNCLGDREKELINRLCKRSIFRM